MPPINPPTSTLSAIETKVRRLTRSPSTAQLSQSDLDNYINTFIVYDFPEHLRMFNLRTTFNFWCNPYQDVYNTDIFSFGGASDAEQNDLYNFQNLYLSVHDPVYIAGYQSFYTQSPEQFYGIYPRTNNIQSIGPVGDGMTTTFTGFIPILSGSIVPNSAQAGACLVKGNVLFSSVDINSNGLSLVDVPILDSVTGNPTVWGNLYVPGQQPSTPPLGVAPYTPMVGGAPNSDNYVNYVTGQFTITFPTAPMNGSLINSQTIPQIVSLPQALLYYDNQFIVRPVPDQPYQINIEAYSRPTALLSENQSPQLEEWWQYIAYGAAKKILEDRMDMETVQLILPEFNKQQRMCSRRSIVQYTNERVATIYTDQVNIGSNNWGWGNGGGSF